MKRAPISVALVLIALALAAQPARADWVEYNLPGTSLVMLIPAREVKPIAGKIYVVSHEFGTIYARFEDVGKIYKAPTVSAQFDKKLSQANAKKNAASLLDVARWAIQRGLIRQFHSTVDKILELDP